MLLLFCAHLVREFFPAKNGTVYPSKVKALVFGVILVHKIVKVNLELLSSIFCQRT